MYATDLDLSMVNSSRYYCTIVLPWGKYAYLRLPIGLSISTDVVQERMGELFAGVEFVRSCIDDLLVVSSCTFEDHLSNWSNFNRQA